MIVAIDPGSEKTGIAILRQDGTLVEKHIIPSASLAAELTNLQVKYGFTHIAMGDGTCHKHLQGVVAAWLAKQIKTIVYALVDEKNTTVEGRQLYFRMTPRRGWRRVVPLCLQFPPVPVDDFVAWIIGQRYIQQQGENV